MNSCRRTKSQAVVMSAAEEENVIDMALRNICLSYTFIVVLTDDGVGTKAKTCSCLF